MGRSPDPAAAARQRANLLPGVSPDPKAAARQRANLQRGRLDGAGDNSEQALEPLRERALEVVRDRYPELDREDGRLYSMADRMARIASATAWLDEMGSAYGLGVVRDRKGNVFPVVDRLDKWRNGLDRLELAAVLSRSERWAELKAKEGMPMEEATDRYGRRRYNLRLVQAWLNDGRPKAAREDRVAALERQVAELAAQLAELRQAG
jgi:hypothetical protein